MELQSNQPRAIPSWVVMDQEILYKDPGSFRTDGETSAETCASNGEPVRVSFDLYALPGSSRLYLYCPEEREPSCWDTVVAAHANAVLFRIKVNFPGLHVYQCARDYFIYRAGPSGPQLTLLPRCYSTELEVMTAAPGSWRTERRMGDCESIGLLLAGDEFVVAELDISSAGHDHDEPLEAELFRLHSHVATIDGEWELKRPRIRDGKVKFRDVLCWETHKVVPFASYLCWVDYYRGLLLCDVYHETPELHYLPLPVDDVPDDDPYDNNKGHPEVSRTVCVTKGETMKFINVVRSNGMYSGYCKPGSDFTIIVWTLRVEYNHMMWVEDATIKADELWAMEGYDHDQLPRIAPLFPLVSMDDPSVLYFVLRKRVTLSPEEKTWIVTLDMESKTILGYKDIKAKPSEGDDGMASHNIFCSFGFFPCEFSNYLKNRASWENTVSEEKERKRNRKKKKRMVRKNRQHLLI